MEEMKRGPGRPRREETEGFHPDLRPDEPRVETEAMIARAEETPQERAARRTAEILEQNGGAMNGDSDDFFIEPGIIPEGWAYEWKRIAIFNAPDPAYEVSLAQAGWEAVPLKDHPSLMPRGWTGSTIERKGLRLYRRPAQIVQMVRDREKKAARSQMQGQLAKLGQTPAGQFGRVDDGGRDAESSRSVVRNHGYEAIPVPQV